MSKTAKVILAVGAVFAVLCLGGIILAVAGVNEAVQEAETVVETTAPEVKPSVAPAPFKAIIVKTGTHVVGKDIPAGTYKTVNEVGNLCSWDLTTTGSNGADYINGGVPTGGRPEVTVKVGQDFRSSGCGNWQRIR
jgi:hypothetical protein